ncbi:MAG TPA: anthranilate synthase component I family protein, partial [Candidatus Polarisedimenticolaceae bacterium]|nr:anthranilate synthase component I family protein [Candidatus Polarisedimenticolaceae bacterium]
RSRRRSAGPSVLVLEVDAAVQFGTAGEPRLHVTPAADDPARLRRYLERAAAETPWPAVPPARGARTSLPREAYLRAVGEIRQSIVRGDVYQANLCQMFEVACEEPPLDVYARLAATTPAPRSAFLAVPGFALASVSPETFLVLGSPDRIETVPIKGTRPRGATPDADARAAQELQASDKDRAELLMVVDLERNDLSRVCRPGTVDVTDLATVRSYPAVHHLVARVSGRLRPGVGFSDVIHAAFPGGSISGAPKECALEILEQLEPVPRGPFTGALCWLGDDGRIESSVLIRSVTLEGGVARLGAGGGIVFDSDPQAEWEESNHKARALAGALGFAPELAR